MKVEFRTYCGLAGDLQELLIGETECGRKESILYTRVGIFKLFWLRLAKRRVMRKLEIMTGRKPIEG